jgi:hypothetical protein
VEVKRTEAMIDTLGYAVKSQNLSNLCKKDEIINLGLLDLSTGEGSVGVDS